MSQMKRIVGFSGVSLLLFATLTGCSFGACPAIAYLYSVEVRVSGELVTLEACAAGDCVSSADAPAEPLMFAVTPAGVDTWTVGAFPSTPDRLTLRARDAAGVVIAEERYDLDWTRTGGSEQCGGPMETPALEFTA